MLNKTLGMYSLYLQHKSLLIWSQKYLVSVLEFIVSLLINIWIGDCKWSFIRTIFTQIFRAVCLHGK